MTPLTKLLCVVLLLIGAYIGGKLIADGYMEALRAPQKNFREASEKELRDFREESHRKADLAKEKDDKIIQRGHARIAELRRQLERGEISENQATREAIAVYAEVQQQLNANTEAFEQGLQSR